MNKACVASSLHPAPTQRSLHIGLQSFSPLTLQRFHLKYVEYYGFLHANDQRDVTGNGLRLDWNVR